MQYSHKSRMWSQRIRKRLDLSSKQRNRP
jgi:hypothetical protein